VGVQPCSLGSTFDILAIEALPYLRAFKCFKTLRGRSTRLVLSETTVSAEYSRVRPLVYEPQGHTGLEMLAFKFLQQFSPPCSHCRSSGPCENADEFEDGWA